MWQSWYKKSEGRAVSDETSRPTGACVATDFTAVHTLGCGSTYAALCHCGVSSRASYTTPLKMPALVYGLRMRGARSAHYS